MASTSERAIQEAEITLETPRTALATPPTSLASFMVALDALVVATARRASTGVAVHHRCRPPVACDGIR